MPFATLKEGALDTLRKKEGTKRKSQFQNNSLTLCFSTRQRSFKLLHITGTSDNSKSN